MKIHFFPYDFIYKIKDEQPYVYLFGKLDNGEKVVVRQAFQPYFYAKVHDIDQEGLKKRLTDLSIEVNNNPLAKVLKWEKVEKELLGNKGTFWKIYTNYPKAVPVISQKLQSWGVECYETDILFVHRYLRDLQITPFTLVEAEGEFVEDREFKIALFQAENVKQQTKEVLTTAKILAIDIETYAPSKAINPQKNPILMIAIYGENYKKVITWKRFPHKLDYLEYVDDEVELLRRFQKIIQTQQPDIITGYYSDGFDLPYLQQRAEKHNLKLELGVDNSEMVIRKDCHINGVLHLDMFKFIRNIFGYALNTDSYSLDAVSEELLGHRKHAVKIEELAHIWDEEPEKLTDFCEYNLHDAHLTYQLCLKLLPDMIEFTKIISLPPFDIIRMRFSRLVENYILKRAIEYNVLAPNRPQRHELEQRTEETYEGGFVYEPTPGLYEDIAVFDFRSLYPTVIIAHNIGPESLHCRCCKNDQQAKVPGKEELWYCLKDKKFIPKVLEQLILRRIDLKRLIKETREKGEETKILEARSYAIKTLANSFYGYLGFFGARWYCLECAKSTTAYARNYIQNTIQKAEQKGFKVIYADTDSCFLLLGDKIIDQAKEFMNEVNFELPGHMELEYEGFFPRGIFVALKGSDKGAKKKYALLKEDGKIKITGFETVRRNWSIIAKEVQKKVLNLVLQNKVEEALKYIRETITLLKSGKVPLQKLIIKTQITKDLSRYTSIGPHVAVAKKLLEKGVPVSPGMVVEYIITKGLGLVRERAQLAEEVKVGEYDYNYYLNNQIIPAVNSIFLVLGYSEDDLLGEATQQGLGKFF